MRLTSTTREIIQNLLTETAAIVLVQSKKGLTELFSGVVVSSETFGYMQKNVLDLSCQIRRTFSKQVSESDNRIEFLK